MHLILRRSVKKAKISAWVVLLFCLQSQVINAQSITSSSPSSNETSVLASSNISLDFDADINLSTVTNGTTLASQVYDDNIIIIGNLSGQLEGVYSNGADNSIIIFDPSIDFLAGEKISIIITDQVLTVAVVPAVPTSINFRIATGPFEGAFLERPAAGLLGMADGSFDWADYDNDGDLDVLVVGYDDSYNVVSIIYNYNNVTGTFTDIGAGLPGVLFSSSDWGDYDNDGFIDLIITGLDDLFSSRLAVIYHNNGNGTFTDIGAGLQGVSYSSADWGDYDNDGDLDLVVSGRNSTGPDVASTTIYQNTGGVFTDISAGLLGLNTGSVDWGDYDADGDLDLVMTGFDADWALRYTVIYNNNAGVFTDIVAGIPGVNYGDTEWGDYDNDGDLDLLLVGVGSGANVEYTNIYENVGGIFSDDTFVGFPTIGSGAAKFGDYDGDGDLDVVITGLDNPSSTAHTSIFNNNGSGVFTDINAGLSTLYFQGLADWGDIDGDGDLDLLAAGESTVTGSPSAVLYENTVPPFITTWATTDGQITIPTTGGGYDYSISWTNLDNAGVGDGIVGGITGNHTVFGLTSGDTYQVSIWGSFPRIYFNDTFGNKTKIKSIEQWGGNTWQDFTNAFMGCNELVINATDIPNLAGVTSLSRMFQSVRAINAFDNTDLSLWDVSTITDMSYLFYFSWYFNQDISNWDVSNVTTFQYTFAGTVTYNQPLETWVFPVATTMSSMFDGAQQFNQPLQAWDVSGVTDMSFMFYEAAGFSQPLNGWTVSAVANMGYMFYDGIFDQPLNLWNVSAVTDMSYMFNFAQAFNQPINDWDVSGVSNMEGMFDFATVFNQSLGDWDISSVTNMSFMLNDAGLSTANYDATLIGWADDNGGTETIPLTISLDANILTYCTGASAHATLLAGPYNWVITDSGQQCAFITTWLATADGQITIPTTGGGYLYDVYWENTLNALDNGSLTGEAGNAVILGLTDGATYRVAITGTFPRIFFNNGGDRNKIRTIEQWGDQTWTSMGSAFYGCSNLTISATDTPDLSATTDLSYMFAGATSLNSDISSWDVSTVADMSYMFSFASSFNQDIGTWDMSSVTTIQEMFTQTGFDQDLSGWTFASLLNMQGAFKGSLFNNGGQPLTWGNSLTTVTDMSLLFNTASIFNVDISDWNVNSVTDMSGMFLEAFSFDQNINYNSGTGAWNVSNVTNMSSMFDDAFAFNQDISGWNVSNVVDMSLMFFNARTFNQTIDSWDVSKVTDMHFMFENAWDFNQPLNSWNVSLVTDMSEMFTGATAFNQPLNSWNVSNVLNMSYLFNSTNSFNQPLDNWDVSGVTDMSYMFEFAISFDQTLASWDVSNVMDMRGMFDNATGFDQSLGSWDVQQVAQMNNMLDDSGMSTANYDATLIGWADDNGGTETIPTGLTFGAAGLNYCDGASARAILEAVPNNWIITDAGQQCPFITTWLATADGQITIPTTGGGYLYDVYWENTLNVLDNGSLASQATNAIITGLTDGATYRVEISGTFPAISFNNGGDREKILTVEQWGDIPWASMQNAFYGCTNLTVPALDTPDLSLCVSMAQMFQDATSFNAPIGGWDIAGNINSLRGMFQGATAFNQDISAWDVSGIIDMSFMFTDATAFDQPVNWVNTSLVENMSGMFRGASNFNQDLSGWDVSKVIRMQLMFQFATSFDGNIDNWVTDNLEFVNGIFYGATVFNRDIGLWNVVKVTNMNSMFRSATSFNQDISNWNVNLVTDMSSMFSDASSFDQSLGAWDIGSAASLSGMLDNSGLSTANYDATLIGWDALPSLQSFVSYSAIGLQYCDGVAARANIETTYNWDMTDGGLLCPTNNALDFDGVDDYVTVTQNSNLDGFSAMTVEAWVFRKAIGPDMIAAVYNSNLSNDLFYLNFASSNPNEASFGVVWEPGSVSESLIVHSSVDIPVGQWTHIAGTWSGGTDMRIFINGVDSTVPNVTNTPPAILGDTNIPMTLGAFTRNTGIVDGFLDGQLDETRLWSTARSQVDIQANMFSTLVGNEPNLEAYFNFDQGTDGAINTGINMLPDLTANGNEGTLTNFDLGVADVTLSNWTLSEAFNPFDPTDLFTTEVSVTQIDLSWIDNALNETGYTIERSDGNNANFLALNTVGPDITTYIDNSVTTENGYFYRVIANGTSGDSNPSNEKFGTTISPPGNALDFDGVDDFVDFGDVHDEVFTGSGKAFTIESWVYLTAIGSLGEIIFSKQGNSNCGVDERQLVFSVREDGILRFGYYGDLALTELRTIGGTTILNLNEWYHVAVTYDGAINSNDGLDRVKIYLNGAEEITSILTSVGTLPVAIPDGPAHLAIGSNISSIGAICGGADQIFNGSIDEVRLWNGTRSEVEIQSNMFSELIGNEPNLAAYYRFDQGVANMDNSFPVIDFLPDRSTNNNNGTLNNFTLNGLSSNWVATGAMSQPMLLSTVPAANAIDIASNSNIEFTFSDFMSQNSIDAGSGTVLDDNIQLRSASNGLIDGTWTGDGTATITFDPTIDFDAGEVIHITVTSAVQNSGGLSLSQSSNFSFCARTTTGPSTPAFFAEQVVSTMADGAWSVQVGDVDGDGDLDILSASIVDDKIAWYENDGAANPSFTEQAVSTTADFARSVQVGDVDGDGDLDILSASEADDKIAWYENDGAANPSFTERVVSIAADFAWSVQVGDVDGDGDLDILSASILDNKIAWYENDGAADPTFTEQVVSTAAINARSVQVGDVDGDGDLDILSASFSDNKIAWYENDGALDPTFTEGVVSTGASQPTSVDVGDVDGDGDLDVLVSSSLSNRITWYENDGAVNPSFTERVVTSLADNAENVQVGDVDGDGDLDILSASIGDDKIAWYENDGAAIPLFTERIVSSIADGASSVQVGDVDGDGDLDILSASFIDDKIAWYENTILLESEIVVYEGAGTGGAQITDAQAGVIDLGMSNQGSDLFFDISIENTGSAILNISSITSSATEYSFVAIPPTVVIGGFSTFTLQLEATLVGQFPSTITINSDDTDEAVFTFPVSGEITLTPDPEISVFLGADNLGTPIADGLVVPVDFGNAVIGSDVDLTFAIENTGSSDLNISSVNVAGDAEFSILVAPSVVSSGATETFDVRLSGAGAGTFNSTITISNDDADEGTFDFPITGSITLTAEPEISVFVGSDNLGMPVVDGQLGAVDLGTSLQGTDIDQLFAIENIGSTDLTISGITVGGADFSVVPPPLTIGVGATEIFTLRLSGAAVGSFNDVLTIQSDDTDEAVFDFPLTGTILAPAVPEIAVYLGSDNTGTEIVNAQLTPIDFGSGLVDEVISLDFTIENQGTADLSIVDVTSSMPEFGAVSSAPTIILPGAFENFVVSFSSTLEGQFSSNIVIDNDDSDEAPFGFAVSGQINPPTILVYDGPDTTGSVIVDNQDISMGSTLVDVVLERSFVIENPSSTTDLTVSSITVDDPVFEILTFTPVVPPLGLVEFTVLLDADNIGVYSTTVTVVTSINTFSFILSGDVTANSDPDLNIYNAITPNGDGIHDSFKIGNISFYTNNSVVIYNRWGDKIFEANGYNNDSNAFVGESNTGGASQLDTGNYYYVIDKGNDTKKITGFLFLKR